jgi:hypothetical protein
VPLTVGMSQIVRQVQPLGVPRRSPVDHVRGWEPGAGAGCGWLGIRPQGDSESIGSSIIVPAASNRRGSRTR